MLPAELGERREEIEVPRLVSQDEYGMRRREGERDFDDRFGVFSDRGQAFVVPVLRTLRYSVYVSSFKNRQVHLEVSTSHVHSDEPSSVYIADRPVRQLLGGRPDLLREL